MRAAYMSGPGHFGVADYPVPEISTGDVLVRMHYASICGSDLHIMFDGFHLPNAVGRPGYSGHEGVGIVAESRSPHFSPGDTVLTVPDPDRAGCFAEFQSVDDGHVIALPGGADMRALLPAQQLGTTIYGLKKFLRTGLAGGVAVVLGCGSAGLFFVQLLAQRGFDQVLASDVSESRLALAAQLGASQTIRAPHESVVDAVMDVTGGVGADLMIDAAGYDSCRNDAVEATRPRGVIGLFGYPERKDMSPFPIDRCFRKALTLEWTVGTQDETGLASFREAVDAIHDGTVKADYCVGEGFELERIEEALRVARDHDRSIVKVEVDITAGT